MSAVSDFIPTKKIKGKNTPLGSQVKSSTLCGKRRLLAHFLLAINNRSIANCVQRPILYARAVRFITSAHLTQISRGSLNAFGPFLTSRIKRGPSLKRRARAMTISRALKHQRLNRSPSCLTLVICRSSLPPQRSALCSAPFTPSHSTLN